MASDESAITIQFTTVSKLFEEIYAGGTRDALVVQNVSQQDYTDIDNERERGRLERWSNKSPSLRSDMKWWFSASDHQVNIVLLVKFDPSSEDIIIERWQAAQGDTASLEPSRSQVITISRGLNTETVDNVSGGPLRLDFELLFLRAPRQGEDDIVLPAGVLQHLADTVRRVRSRP
ncbi:hypothetical protein NW754_016519 [Fusarium falciforme]|nr:hypothetical protein NW754_016519 [Fusarium falciforme]